METLGDGQVVRVELLGMGFAVVVQLLSHA